MYPIGSPDVARPDIGCAEFFSQSTMEVTVKVCALFATGVGVGVGAGATTGYQAAALSNTGGAINWGVANSSGVFWGSGGGSANNWYSANGYFINSNTITSNITVTSGNNALSIGPITVNNNVTTLVQSASRWIIL